VELFPAGDGPMITAAVSASLTIIASSYNVPEMEKYVNFINLMCYDYNFYREYYPLTGHNSPLFSRKDEIIFFNTWNIAWSANYWNELGMPKSKIVVGLPIYGHTFKLYFNFIHTVHSLAKSEGIGNGSINYPEACDFLKSGGIRTFDNESKVPYAYMGNDWISYEDEESITDKAKWIAQNSFRGVMTWNLNSDDWSGKCNGTKFPLHKILKDIVH